MSRHTEEYYYHQPGPSSHGHTQSPSSSRPPERFERSERHERQERSDGRERSDSKQERFERRNRDNGPAAASGDPGIQALLTEFRSLRAEVESTRKDVEQLRKEVYGLRNEFHERLTRSTSGVLKISQHLAREENLQRRNGKQVPYEPIPHDGAPGADQDLPLLVSAAIIQALLPAQLDRYMNLYHLRTEAPDGEPLEREEMLRALCDFVGCDWHYVL